MRLIDANKLGLTDFEIFMCDGDYKEALKLLLSKIDNAPTIDATPVVRCSYCKFFKEEEGGGECGLTYMWLSDNDYCSLAERIGNYETD